MRKAIRAIAITVVVLAVALGAALLLFGREAVIREIGPFFGVTPPRTYLLDATPDGARMHLLDPTLLDASSPARVGDTARFRVTMLNPTDEPAVGCTLGYFWARRVGPDAREVEPIEGADATLARGVALAPGERREVVGSLAYTFDAPGPFSVWALGGCEEGVLVGTYLQLDVAPAE